MDQIAPAELQRVLVVLINRQRDWQRVCEGGWYRIPLKHAPLPVAAEYLAFYHTRVFGPDAYQIRAYAAVHRYRIVARRDLLPDEAEHPRAAELYYQMSIGPLQWLDRPVRSRRLRRITFIPTTLQQLLTAQDVADLWHTDEAAAVVWSYFGDAALKATRSLRLEEQGTCYSARDFNRLKHHAPFLVEERVCGFAARRAPSPLDAEPMGSEASMVPAKTHR